MDFFSIMTVTGLLMLGQMTDNLHCTLLGCTSIIGYIIIHGSRRRFW